MIPADMGRIQHLIDVAKEIATDAHRGQTDKSGHDYITHPLRVAENAMTVPHDPMMTHVAQLYCAALLHDVIEDGPDNGYKVDLRAWRDAGFGEDTIEAVQLLSYRKPRFEPGLSPIQRAALIKQSKIDYYLRIANHHIARPVKLADLADNCNLQRQEELKSKGAHFDPEKYPLALAVIDPTPEEWEWFNNRIKEQVL